MNYTDLKNIVSDKSLPIALVDLESFDANVAHVSKTVANTGFTGTIRVATKSLRVPALIRRVLAAGPPFQGLMCYSAREVEFLAGQGFDDFLLAYPTYDPKDLEALQRVHQSGKRVALMVDSREGVDRLESAFAGVPQPFPLLIEVDMALRLLGGLIYLGVRRSPIYSVQQVMDLAGYIREQKNVCFGGLMGYEAQVAGLGDRNPFKKLINPAAALVRKWSARVVRKLRQAIANEFARRQWELPLFNGGGSGSLNLSARESCLTEVTAGSAFVASHLFDYYSNITFRPAAFFAVQVDREPAPNMVTCLGGGYVASGEPGWDKVPVPYLPRGARLVSTEACGEVQTPVMLPKGASVKLGDPIFFRHAKAGELAERFNQYHLFERDQIVEVVPTYRGAGQSFL